ncbi:MAG TPA: vitamin K epoxide reductase family protein [Vicinamibacterales bacterium]|nr:vitamin K epoxide reductase family protein [Vicinamibacterales bacterium]
MTSLSRKLLVLCALLGLGASSAATYVHYNLIRNPDYSSFCDINATVSCKAAYLSQYGSVMGVPVAVGGIVFFGWVLLMLWGAAGKSRIKDSAPAYIFAGSTLALAIVLYLAYASFFVLKEVCPLCVATYVAVIGIFIVSGGASSVPMSSLPKRALADMRVLIATPLALVIALLFVAGTALGLTTFPREAASGGGAVASVAAAAAAPAAPLTAQQQEELQRWWAMQPVSPDFPYPNEGAKVLIVEFADFQCPHCRQMYLAYKPILDKFQAQYPKDVKFVFKTWPISSKCNPTVPGINFVATCEASAAYQMAKKNGTDDRMKDWFFVNQEQISVATVKRIAGEMAGVKDFEAEYQKVIGQVRSDAEAGSKLGVNSTPSFFVNARRIPGGGMPPQYFEALLDLELKKAK